MKLCMVEDDLALGAALLAALRDAGHDAQWVRRLADARRVLASDDAAEVVLLDLGLPDGEGLELLVELRARASPPGVLIISAREALSDRLGGLSLGADDYLVKPFAVAEMLARLAAIGRRLRPQGGGAERVFEHAGLQLNETRRLVLQDGHPVHLSPTEFELLRLLIARPGWVVTRGDLEDRIATDRDSQSLDVHIANLRRKLGKDALRTVRGVGYALSS